MDIIGILAYGSLIEDPGEPLLALITRRIDTVTPFPVEFARQSRSRSNGPTLIPFPDGLQVKAQILVLTPETTVAHASNLLYQRETRQTDRNYLQPADEEVTLNTTLVETLTDFEEVGTVLYTRLGSNIDSLSPATLAELAMNSARAEAGANRTDGINYLMLAKRNGIRTALSEAYEQLLLEETAAEDLEQAYQHCRTKGGGE